jgi:periplasmic protein TonB
MPKQDFLEFDTELERALSAALAREEAPVSLMAGIESVLRAREIDARRAPAVPNFQPLSFAPRSLWTNVWSTGAHATAFALIALVVFAGGKTVVVHPKLAVTPVMVKPYRPMTAPGREAMNGGGGGGAHDVIEASKGHLPKISDRQMLPPQLIRNEAPKLPMEATIVAPPEIKLPDTNLPNVGMPQSPQVALASQGPGSRSGFGSGSQGGIGSGDGPGVGPGSDGGYGGGIMHAGPGVSEPKLLSWVDAEFSDEARRNKHVGICVVEVTIGEDGVPRNPRVVRPLGMGLDEKAVEAVRQYKFKPAYYKGRPVAVEMDVIVNFHIL